MKTPAKKRKKPGPPRTTGPGAERYIASHEHGWRNEKHRQRGFEVSRRTAGESPRFPQPEAATAHATVAVLTQSLAASRCGQPTNSVASWFSGVVVAGLATMAGEMARAGGCTIEVVLVRITDAGRKALEG